MPESGADKRLDVGRLTTAVEDFNAVFIRLASVERMTFSALSVLHSLSRGGPLRLTDLVASEQIKQPALTALVAKLERDGLVIRAPDPDDGRAALLGLTEAGERVVAVRHADRVAGLTRLVAQLDERDQTVLADAQDVLGRLVAIAGETASDPAPLTGRKRRQRGARG